MKYRIKVPPPKAKRMKGSGQVCITVGYKELVFPVGEIDFFEFEIPDGVPWKYATSATDGEFFEVKLIYANKDRTREEVINSVPESI